MNDLGQAGQDKNVQQKKNILIFICICNNESYQLVVVGSLFLLKIRQSFKVFLWKSRHIVLRVDSVSGTNNLQN